MFGFGKDNKKDNDVILTNAVLSKASPNHSLCPSLDIRTRIKGFAICLFFGTILGLFSCGLLKTLKEGNRGLIKFTVIYVLGVALSIGSSMFLWGP